MRAALLVFAACAVAAPALAQAPSGAVLDRAARAAEIAEQDRGTDRLNAATVRRNAEIDARNAATRAAYEKAESDYQAALAEHRKAVQAIDAAAALDRSTYLKAMEAWRLAVAACKAGDAKACAEPPPP